MSRLRMSLEENTQQCFLVFREVTAGDWAGWASVTNLYAVEPVIKNRAGSGCGMNLADNLQRL